MTFLHWRYPPAQLERFLPAGFRPQLHDGSAWVGLTPFMVEGARPPVLPAVPGLSDFPETNLRTYVVGPDGRDAIWFFSLEAGSLALTVAARVAFAIPYCWADMHVERGPRITYRSTRRPPHRPVGHHIVVEPREPFAPDELTPLDHFLTGRWRAVASVAGRRAYVAVRHQPWPLQRATVVDLEEDLLAAAGLPPAEGPPLVHHSSTGVDATLGSPMLVR